MSSLKKGQGSTEYLILLAVVLIVALVSIALLGFFPGMSTDAQLTQNKAYWNSASPIAIVEAAAQNQGGGGVATIVYLRIRNVGGSTIQLTGIFSGNSTAVKTWPAGDTMANNSYLLISPGAEVTIGEQFYTGAISGRDIMVTNPDLISCAALINNHFICSSSVKTLCSGTSSSNGFGYLNMESFGFTFNEYVDGIPISKKQFGAKPLMAKCNSPSP